MNPREQTLALVLIGLIALGAAGAGGYFLILQPLQKQRTEEAALTAEIEELEKKVDAQAQTRQRLALARVRSLPADKALAQREYVVALKRLADSAGLKDSQITPQSVDNSPRAVPELAKNKPIYTRVAYEVQFKKADLWAVKDFLQGYYQMGLLHQVTAINIKKDDDPGAKGGARRDDLTVALTTEAILVDGAENRRTLLPVPTAYAALGGGAMYRGMTLNPDAARNVRPAPLAPVLSPAGRDYNWIVLKDPFHGPMKITPTEQPKPFKLAKISDVKVKTDEKPSAVRYSVSGDGSNGATVTALVSGGELYAEGALKVNAKDYTIELPTTSALSGSATVSVIATSADGKNSDKGSFKVSIAEAPPKKVEPGEDISAFVLLIGTTPRSDGTAWARIKDNASRLRYEIEAKRTGVTVTKQWFVLEWKPDRDYDEKPGVLHISAENTKTNRLFQIIAVDGDGLIVADLRPDGSAPAPAPKAPGKGKFPIGGPPRGGPPSTKQGHASPLAALGGNRIVAAPKRVLYRWEVGQPLSKIEPIAEEDAKKILKAAEAAGPVFDVSAIMP